MEELDGLSPGEKPFGFSKTGLYQNYTVYEIENQDFEFDKNNNYSTYCLIQEIPYEDNELIILDVGFCYYYSNDYYYNEYKIFIINGYIINSIYRYTEYNIHYFKLDVNSTEKKIFLRIEHPPFYIRAVNNSLGEIIKFDYTDPEQEKASAIINGVEVVFNTTRKGQELYNLNIALKEDIVNDINYLNIKGIYAKASETTEQIYIYNKLGGPIEFTPISGDFNMWMNSIWFCKDIGEYNEQYIDNQGYVVKNNKYTIKGIDKYLITVGRR